MNNVSPLKAARHTTLPKGKKKVVFLCNPSAHHPQMPWWHTGILQTLE